MQCSKLRFIKLIKFNPFFFKTMEDFALVLHRWRDCTLRGLFPESHRTLSTLGAGPSSCGPAPFRFDRRRKIDAMKFTTLMLQYN